MNQQPEDTRNDCKMVSEQKTRLKETEKTKNKTLEEKDQEIISWNEIKVQRGNLNIGKLYVE